ncbi:hypothetical protein [Desulfospira joergensenii]|uniref:hypothetical protein n=1 Tax=Desulfospira joergensenii TaxID=53329 RepID=UPI0003B60164|nr:hypothetical protein [Desulfospira joergensenii]
MAAVSLIVSPKAGFGRLAWALGLALTLLAPDLYARTSLVSLPARTGVSIRLDGLNPALVQEKRVLSLKKGLNKVDFSWQNVSIDPFSILLDPRVEKDGKPACTLMSVSFPPNESALVWEIHSKEDRAQPVVISYLLSGIDSLVTYQALADPGEKFLRLQSYLILRNFSGEDFDPAAVWLNPASSFSVQSRNLETRKILWFDKKKIPVTKVYTWDSAIMPHDPEKEETAVGIPTGYRIRNTSGKGLGFADLSRGKTRIFTEDRQDTFIFSGEDRVRFIPRGDEVLVETGKSRDILVTKLRMDTQRTRIRRNKKGKIQIYDEIIKDRYSLENTKDRAVTLTLKEHLPGEWEPVKMDLDYIKEDSQTLVFEIPLNPREKKSLDLEYRVRNIVTGRLASSP